jgi:hypothetical protein
MEPDRTSEPIVDTKSACPGRRQAVKHRQSRATERSWRNPAWFVPAPRFFAFSIFFFGALVSFAFSRSARQRPKMENGVTEERRNSGPETSRTPRRCALTEGHPIRRRTRPPYTSPTVDHVCARAHTPHGQPTRASLRSTVGGVHGDERSTHRRGV